MTEEIKRRPGRPKNPPKVETKAKPKMRARPNWETVDINEENFVDRLHLPKSFQEKHKEYSFQWVTNSVLGQEDPQHRGQFEKGGWTPVHADDFDGELDGMFTKKGDVNEINVGGQVLMARPVYLTERARKIDKAAALEQVQIKEQALRGGDLPVTLDAQHPTAIQTNRIGKTIERIDVPDK